MTRKPIIIDCDPGIDDAFTLFLAYACDELDLKGITTVSGNVSVDKTTSNALKIVEFLGKDTPVVKGASSPIEGEAIHAEHVHGVSGLKDIVLPNETRAPLDGVSRFIYKTLKENPYALEIIAIGPLTNIAQLFIDHPDSVSLIKRLIIMGGGHRFGNITPAAEFNIYADVKAAEIVFGQDVDIHVISLDATMDQGLSKEDIEGLFTKSNAKTEVMKALLMTSIATEGSHFPPFAFIHDALALLYTIDHNVVKGGYYPVAIETEGKYTYGKTVVDIFGITKARKRFFTTNINKERFLSVLKAKVRFYH